MELLILYLIFSLDGIKLGIIITTLAISITLALISFVQLFRGEYRFSLATIVSAAFIMATGSILNGVILNSSNAMQLYIYEKQKQSNIQKQRINTRIINENVFLVKDYDNK